MVAITAKSKAFTEKRIKQGLSLQDIAEKADIHYTTVNRLEKGERSTNPRTAKKICDALEVEFDELFEIKVHTKEGA